MKRALFAFAALPMLCACPSPGSINSASAAHACTTALDTAATAQDLAQFFIAHGIEPVRAAKVAAALRTFQMTAGAACALLPPPAPAP